MAFQVEHGGADPPLQQCCLYLAPARPRGAVELSIHPPTPPGTWIDSDGSQNCVLSIISCFSYYSTQHSLLGRERKRSFNGHSEYIHARVSTISNDTHERIIIIIMIITPWSIVLPGKRTGPQLVRKFPAFYGTRRLTTAFTAARHMSLF